MTNLIIKIDKREKVITFEGDTFNHKDLIKSLGKCRWDGVKKNWIVSNILMSKEKILNIFPGSLIHEIESETEQNLETFSPEPKKANQELEDNSCSVGELLVSIKRALTISFPGVVRVFGILSSVKQLSNGRVYFDLAGDDNSSVRCVLWESSVNELEKFKKLGLGFEDNIPVLMEGSVSFNSKNGQVSLVVSKFFPEYTIGKIQALREKTNERLKLEGVFYKNIEKSLTFLPKRLGILTSSSGTVINDFKASLQVCNFGFIIFWLPVQVQGVSAESDIVNGIRFFQEEKNVDAILIFRGGGSATDLAIFNSYEIAKTICMSSVPILSAIGHEYDQCSAQDVSYKSFGVPKDIGRFFSDIIITRKEDLNDFGVHLAYEAQRIISEAEKNLSLIAYRLLKQSQGIFRDRMRCLINSVDILKVKSVNIVHQSENQIRRSADMIFSRTNLIIENNFFKLKSFRVLIKRGLDLASSKLTELAFFEGIIFSFSPKIQLARGYGILRDINSGEVLISIEELKRKEEAILEMQDGQAIVKIENERKSL